MPDPSFPSGARTRVESSTGCRTSAPDLPAARLLEDVGRRIGASENEKDLHLCLQKALRELERLIRDREELEERVRIRTRELVQANLDLHHEIEERRITEKALRERESELMVEKINLQEANTALKVLLGRREADKKELEEQIHYNIGKLVLPYLQKAKKERDLSKIHATMGIIESNLRDITCGFSRRLSLEFYGLSAAETKIANFIRQGKKSREIADLLNISIRTVESFRQSIRRKLGLDHQKMNLRTFLMGIG